MTKKFLIGGEIIADESQRWAFEDVTVNQVKSFFKNLDDSDEVEMEISSCGGSVTAGIAIANMIKAECKKRKCKGHVIGIAASMASVIACAFDELEIDESAFMMIHNPWTVAMGDSEDLRKEADLLDQMRGAILSFYRSKFDKTDDELITLMNDETWFTGAEADDFGFKAVVIPNAEPLKVAACARKIPTFAKLPTNAAGLIGLGHKKEVKMDNQEVPTTIPTAEPKEEVKTETPVGTPAETPVEPTPAAETPVETPATQDTVTLAECEKRVSGMQSAMAKQIDTVKAEYEAKIVEFNAKLEDFQNQLSAKVEELAKVNADVISLTEAKNKAEGELTEKSSALETAQKALETLNSTVNSQTDGSFSDWTKAYREMKKSK